MPPTPPEPAAVLARPHTAEQWLYRQLVRLSACIAHETQTRGGVLLHSGLAAHPESSGSQYPAGLRGFLLAGRSGVGKSTAAGRLPSPWRVLADDETLVVRDERGRYWAHPWITWSRLCGREKGDGRDTWDAQRAVPLRAIFVLEQGEKDLVEPLGPGHAAALLTELAKQTALDFLRGLPLERTAAFNLQRFKNVCALVRAVPTFTLYVSRHGAFWEEIARVMSWG